MPKYRVYVEQVSYASVEVEAEDETEALVKAEDEYDWLNANVAPPVALSAARLEIHNGHEVTRDAA